MVAFLTLAEERHVGRTAARLGVSRQTVSRHVTRLEELLGEPLVIRSTRRIELTETGALLRDEAGPALRGMEEALHRIRLGVGRRLSIAISTDLGHRWEARVQEWIVRRGTPVLLEQRAPDEALALLRGERLDSRCSPPPFRTCRTPWSGRSRPSCSSRPSTPPRSSARCGPATRATCSSR